MGRRRMAAGAVVGLLACFTAVGAVNDDPSASVPPLLMPAELPPLDVPIPPASPSGVVPAPTAGPQPILAVPGLPTTFPTATATTTPTTTAPPSAETGPIGGDGPPPLVAPAAIGSTAAPAAGLDRFPPLELPPSVIGTGARPELSFDAVPPPLVSDPPDARGTSSRPRMVAPPSSPLAVPVPPASEGSDGGPLGASSSSPSASDPPRRRLFGWITTPWGPPRASSLPAAESIRVEARVDPAADAALQRRVEAQVRDAVGGQLRALDVRVHGREVEVTARVQRFWNKRPVKRAIEALPALAGTRANVEVTE